MLKRVAPAKLEVTDEARELAHFYVDSGIISPRKIEDALHVAVSTVHEMDAPLILTPLEVLHG